ncbi:hypothetical protein Q428_10885 [Fervidicella metallireducens AeB]|uniref:Polymerase beta nucleotidyltransferase domain-containing protein n=1 Tax=Fervidicella metallireducens AeB TaxID=1403537 RepID=A0A017RVE0_9CLOT|nr:nucleotidyltransferase domain-containing protein [Fervidicella metallireducens]EYE87880.1 hypothetical protein Q428_10885 [Fervidicella metallireducens AeB]
MLNNIRLYQDAYEEVLNKLKKNSQIAAVLVYGSMVSGDIWEKSDIDLMVISEEKGKIESIYTKINNIMIHINYISKDVFGDSFKNLLRGGTLHKAFFTGKLVYCKDREIEEIYQSTRFYGDKDKKVRNVEILYNLLRSMHYTKKYKVTGKIETSFEWCVETLNNYARLLMSMNGHITDKDVLSFAVNMSSEVEYIYGLINSDKRVRDKIEETLEIIDNFLENNMEEIASPIIEFLREQKYPCSSEDIKNSEEFRIIGGNFNELLDKLSQMGLIRETTRVYSSYGEEYLIDEIVYYVD